MNLTDIVLYYEGLRNEIYNVDETVLHGVCVSFSNET